MINSKTLYPWPLGIMQYQGQYGTDWGKVLAFVSLTLAPALIFYLMAQKHTSQALLPVPSKASLTFSQNLRVCEKVTRRKLLGKQLARANAFAANPDPAAATRPRDRHSVRISHGA